MHVKSYRLESDLLNMKPKLNTVLDHITGQNTVGMGYWSKYTSTGEICTD